MEKAEEPPEEVIAQAPEALAKPADTDEDETPGGGNVLAMSEPKPIAAPRHAQRVTQRRKAGGSSSQPGLFD